MIASPVAPSRLPVGSSASRIAGRRDRGAGERDPLLLAARELRRIMLEPGGEADRGELVGGAVEGVAGAGELERRRDVLERGHRRDQVEGLEDDADVGAAEARQRVLAHRRQLLRRAR